MLARGLTISRDGRIVAFDSEGVLTSGDGNATRDVFVESCPVARQDDPAFAFTGRSRRPRESLFLSLSRGMKGLTLAK